MRSYANNLAAHSIRVNTVHPTGVDTPMIVTPSIEAFLEANPEFVSHVANAMPVGLVSVEDVAHQRLHRPDPDRELLDACNLGGELFGFSLGGAVAQMVAL